MQSYRVDITKKYKILDWVSIVVGTVWSQWWLVPQLSSDVYAINFLMEIGSE